MIRTKAVLAGAALCAVAAVAGCSSAAPSSAGSTSGPVTLTYWSGFTGGDQATYVALVKMFNATHKNIHVNMTVQPWDSIAQKLPTAMASGAGPDIATPDYNPGTIRQYINDHLIAPIDQLLGNGPNQVPASVLPPAVKQVFTVDGHLYAAPGNWATLELYYNKKLFAKAGITSPPTTMTQLENDAVRLTVKSGSTVKQYGIAIADHSTIAMWPIFIWANGGDIVTQKGCSALDEPKTVQAVTTWANLIVKHDITQVGLAGQDADNLFSAQKAAMEINGPWATGEYTPAHVDFGLAPVPTGAIGTPVTTASTVPMVVNAKSTHKAAALTFFAWWMSKPVQAYLAEHVGYPPSRNDMANYPGLKSNPWVAGFSAQSPYAKFYLGTVADFSNVDGNIISPAIQAVERGANVAATLTSASAQLNSALNCPG
ncbi:MAG TPA: ABC transporter substrate-binding protein [Streptosporangiaceae bacterium]|nr:ABC transporter substrate-binding protein [Streptosporangiaceae bacterium]